MKECYWRPGACLYWYCSVFVIQVEYRSKFQIFAWKNGVLIESNEQSTKYNQIHKTHHVLENRSREDGAGSNLVKDTKQLLKKRAESKNGQHQKIGTAKNSWYGG